MNGKSKLVDRKAALVSRDVYSSQEIYRQEQERIFGRAWLYVGHESQIRQPGDYILSRMGEESVIVTRAKTGQIQVMLNSCRHRGMRVLRYDEGRTEKFFCPYHGWSYDLDGSLVFVTEYDREYKKQGFDRSQSGLVKAKVATVRGTIWATWDHSGDIDTFLGPARKLIELSFVAWDGLGEVEVLGTTQKWQIPSNWKIVAENFGGDLLHNISHRSVDMIGIGPNSESGRRDMDHLRHVQASYEEGHGSIVQVFDKEKPRTDYSVSPIVSEYFQDCWATRKRVLGDDAFIQPAVGTIFPNTSFHGNQPRTILASHPVSVDKTEMWRQFFADRNAPPEVKDYLRHYYLRYSGPAGLTEQDDMENWYYATEAAKGTVASHYPYNYVAGIGNESTMSELPGATVEVDGWGERHGRVLYGKWADYMGDL